MTRIYIASSFRNMEINKIVCTILESLNIDVFLPQREIREDLTDEFVKSSLNQKTLVLNRNKEAIKKADVLLIIAKNLGKDTSWECGFGCGLKKPTILIWSKDDSIQNDCMIFNSVQQKINVSTYDCDELKKLIGNIDFVTLNKENILK